MSLSVVAIDGPAGAGKSTIAKLVAQRLGYTYVDSGAMYRAVAVTAMERGVCTEDQDALTTLAQSLNIHFEKRQTVNAILVDGIDLTDVIRSPEASKLSSVVSAVSGVRGSMVAAQRKMAESGGVVMEGRDIGTVVFPDAKVKVFLTASAGERARRRSLELRAKGVDVDVHAVEAEITERDHRDTTRADSPLRAASDAITIDTDGLSIEQVVEAVFAVCRERAG